MIHFQTICVFSSFLLTLVLSISTHAQATQFLVTNNCPYTVWAAAVPGGGEELATGASWAISAKPGSTGARIWARTGCNSTGPNALKCATGDCGGVLRCNGYGPGGAPNTLAEYSSSDPDTNLDSFDISLVDGFNVPMEFSPISGGCTKGVTCNADITGQCPGPLRANGGCNNPCTVFNTFQYCCNGLDETCNPTDYSRYFKSMCPDAYSYPDDSASTLSCPTGTDYRVVFCPANYSSFSFSVDPVVLCY